MKIRNILRCVSLVFAVGFLASCGNLFDTALTAKDPNKGLVSIHISDGNAGARTLIPSDPVFSRYAVSFTSEGKDEVVLSSVDKAVAVELEGGSWTITVKGYVTIQGENYLAAMGEATVSIIPGQPVSASVSIRANNTGEKGIFSYDIRLSLDTGSLSKALLVFESLDSNNQDNPKIEVDLKEEGKETGTFSVKPGFYLVKVQLENDYQAAGKTEVVHIYTGIETRAEYTIRADDLTRTIPLKGTVAHDAGQKKIELFVYSDAAYEDLIVSTEVDLSDGSWKTMIPFDTYEKVYFTLHIEDETGSSSITSAGSANISEIGKAGIVIISPKIISFLISAEEAGLDVDLTGVIDEEQQTITLTTQKWIEHIENLKVTFESTGTVTVGEMEQKSGVTGQDFRSGIVYRITTENNATRDYTVVFESPQVTGLPVMKIDTQGQVITSTSEWVTGSNYALYDINGESISGSTDIKGRGNTTWGMPKKPYSLKLSSKLPLLGMPAHKRWNLLANYSDKTLLRTEVAFQMGEILKDGLKWTPRSRHIQLYMNNEYRGVYQLVEAIKIDENRVAIDNISKKNPQRGYILEIDVREGELFHFTTTKGVVFNCSDPDEELDDVITGDTKTIFEKIQTDVQHVEDVLYSDGFADPDDGYRKYLDVASFVDWYLVNEVTKNSDAIFGTSVFMYYDDAKEKYCMGPIWDFDISLGNYKDSPGELSDGFHIKNANWISRLFEDPEFVLAVKDRCNMKKSEFFALQQYINERVGYINDAQAQNFNRWDILGSIVWPNVEVFGTYQGEINYLKSWLVARLTWLDTAINQL
jgi:hypothetical protein